MTIFLHWHGLAEICGVATMAGPGQRVLLGLIDGVDRGTTAQNYMAGAVMIETLVL